MKTLLVTLFFFCAGYSSFASDSLQVRFTKKTFVTGDTLEFTCLMPQFAQMKMASATLNVWIEDLQKQKRWKFRYPMINGEVSASLAISDKIPDGKYAVNFLVQRGFFRMTGQIRDHFRSDTLINYVMIQKKNGAPYVDNARVAADGSFRLKSMMFADSAFFVFTPVKKTKNNYFYIKVETPLDSSFTPVLQETDFITVGEPKNLLSKKTDTSHYSFSVQESLFDSTTLPGVTVTAKHKRLVDQYNEEFSSGLFNQPEAIVFDGLESEDLERSTDIISFLQGRVPGLSILRNEQGEPYATWRQKPVEIYVDEFLQSSADHLFIQPVEVAMIKVYRPPSMLSGHASDAGAIAIYTKRGRYFNERTARTRHNFVVTGYTRVESTWQ